MTTNQLAHHQEQMEAFRRDFYEWWNPQKAALQDLHINPKLIIGEECRQWTSWLAKRRAHVQH